MDTTTTTTDSTTPATPADLGRAAHAAYLAGLAAEAAYMDTIARLFGRFADRWSLTPEQRQHPEYIAALAAFVHAKDVNGAAWRAFYSGGRA